MLVYIRGQTKVGREATHQKPTRWSWTRETSSRKQAVAFQWEGPPHFPVDADATPQPPPTNQRLPVAFPGPNSQRKGRRAPCGASPFPRCDCFPCGRPSSRQRDICEPVSTWWAVLPGNHPGDSHFPDPRDANCLRTIIRSHNPGGSNFQHSPLCFRRNLSEFTHSSHWRPAHRIPDTFTGSLLQAHVSGSSTTPP